MTKKKNGVSEKEKMCYDKIDNVRRKGKTADMKNEISGAAIEPLFRLNRDAVCGVEHGRIVFANPAADRLFGVSVAGERMEERFPGLEEDIGSDCIASSIVLDGKSRRVTGARCGEVLVLTIHTEEQPFPPIPPTALRQMRNSIFNLRLAVDRLLENDPEYGDDDDRLETSVLFHSYYSMLHLLNELSDINALTTGTMPCRMEPLPIGRIVRDLMDSAEFFLRGRKIQFRWEILGDNLFVVGNRNRLEQLLLILIADCVIRTGDGGTISVRLKRDGQNCRITICDNGQGMTDSELAEAFVPSREDSLTKVLGSGLGLSIAQGLAQLHKGVLAIRRSGSGETSMHLQLPITGKLPVRDAMWGTSGPDGILTELSDVLTAETYQRKYRE